MFQEVSHQVLSPQESISEDELLLVEESSPEKMKKHLSR